MEHILTNLNLTETSFQNPYQVLDKVKLGKNVFISRFVNLYGCTILDDCKIGSFVEIQKDVYVGRKCKICTNIVLCSGVHIGDECFIGNGTIFINDKYPRSTNIRGDLETFPDWKDRYITTKIGNNVSIGSNCTILGGVTVGDFAVIGAGSVVTKNVPAGEVWAGNPAKKLYTTSYLFQRQSERNKNL